jgi:hypothetical protein
MSMAEIDPKWGESIKKVKAPTCKKELQSFLDKVIKLFEMVHIKFVRKGKGFHSYSLVKE